MKKILLLSISVFLFASATHAQSPGFASDFYDGFGCIGSSTFVAIDLSEFVPSTIWQESTDGGSSWHEVPNSPPYSFGVGFFRLHHTAVLYIDNLSLSMNHYLYRVIISDGTSSATSRILTLYVAQDPPGAVEFVNPVTDVCQGAFVQYTIHGGLQEDSIRWGNLRGGGTADTISSANFPNVGTISFNALAINGCGSSMSNTITVTVHPIQPTTAGTTGGGSVCSNFYSGLNIPTTFSDGSCNPIAMLTPSGANPISGNIQSCVTVDATVQSFGGIPYVPRHYSLTSSLTDPSTATATVTLYFTQADFDAYNAARGTNPALPMNSSDAAGIANLHISQFHGTGTTPDTYVGGSGDIDPDDNNIIWNATASRWEVTFDITGFSGFFVSGSSIIPLPLTLTEFSGKTTKAGNQLHWTTAMEENTAYFEIQREGGDSVFVDLAKVPAAGNSNQLLQYDYLDASAAGAYAYRLKMVDLDGKSTYSRILALGSATDALTIKVSPNPAHQLLSLTVGSPEATGAVLTVMDMSGKKILEKQVSLLKGNNSIDPGILARLPQGMYLIGVATDKQQQIVKFVKE